MEQTFELEKEKLREEALIAKENATAAEFASFANSELYDTIRNISRVDWEIIPKRFNKKALKNSGICSRCQAFSIDSYSDTLFDFLECLPHQRQINIIKELNKIKIN